MTSAVSAPFLPRIFYLRSDLVGPISELDMHLDRCIQMGFDHLLIPAQLEQEELSRMCKRKKLRLLIDLDLADVGASRPDWFSSDDGDQLPDPRKTPGRYTRRTLRLDQPRIAEEVLGYWSRRLHSWVDAGVTGFRCMELASTPPHFWKKLIAAVKAADPSVRFLAWTPGCTAQQLEGLPGCGFDATFSSGAWWDYRSGWLAEELARLDRIAPPIAFPDSPDQPIIANVTTNDDTDARRRLYQRALRLAAAIGNGILMPMGFEYGISRPPGNQSHADWLSANAVHDLSGDIASANEFIASNGAAFRSGRLRIARGIDSGLAVLLRYGVSQRGTDKALLIVANADTQHSCAVDETRLLERTDGYVRSERIWPASDIDTKGPLELGAAELQLFVARRMAPILTEAHESDRGVAAAARSARIAIEAITPSVDDGLFPVKRAIGDAVAIEADVFMDGHDKLAVNLLWRAADEPEWQQMRMHFVANDRWAATLPLTRIGRHFFSVEAWRDAFATYRDELEKKTTAGLNVAVELEEGRLLVEAAATYAKEKKLTHAAETLRSVAKTLKASKTSDTDRVAALLSEPVKEAMEVADPRPFAVRQDPPLRIDVDRTAARFSSWYELFPRSQSGDPARHGTFADVIRRLPEIQAMGFDTLYFTPIHPIGSKHRKGRNNSLTPSPTDPGSPYAIGSADGGHDAIHPELGTLDDFRHLRDEAAKHGLELALDFAIQCSPDHPWLKQHPEWFAWRPDGSIRYAENPPKKYQDIVNVDFYAPGAVPGLWIALRDVVLFWVREGVRVFRVDNPHTKPLPFWEWMIADIRSSHPDTIFLSEAFTRPKMMYRLAKIGYAQSYTYFTWRHSKEEFTEYMTELTTTAVREYFRPHFFVNTPDINPTFLQRSGRPGFLIRAALATTLSGLWGMYSGFELCEGAPVPGKEEYLDSEKYEIRAWDWHRPGNIIHEISVLNRIRKENAALQSHLGIRFLNASNDHILYFIKSTAPVSSSRPFGDNVVMVAINLDPHSAQEATIELPLWEFGLPDDGALEAEDLIAGGRLTWHGKFQQIRLDPFVAPYAIWRIRQNRM
ncbi:MAG: alpha-amylase [Burkholderia sp.]|nr:alpha-amylase [Burkholderia sp.]